MAGLRKRIAFMILASIMIGPIHASAETLGPIERVTAGDEILLQDGRVVHLEGVKAPMSGQSDIAQQSIATLQKLTDHADITYDHATTDRYNRLVAQFYITLSSGKKLWLQQEMLRQGMVFVYPPTGLEERIGDMLVAEQEAHNARRGLWREDAYADIPLNQVEQYYGHFVFVVGKVVKASRVKNVVYLNFGDDWHNDFSVAIVAHDLKNFRRADIEPLAYEGKIIRIRGWLKHEYGPMMDVTSPYQIQLLNSSP